MKALPVWAAALLLAPSLLDASRLPIKTYTTADGLARDYVTCIEQDSRGFLWFCTAEGHFHMQNIYGKLQVHSKSEAVSKALRQRLVT